MNPLVVVDDPDAVKCMVNQLAASGQLASGRTGVVAGNFSPEKGETMQIENGMWNKIAVIPFDEEKLPKDASWMEGSNSQTKRVFRTAATPEGANYRQALVWDVTLATMPKYRNVNATSYQKEIKNAPEGKYEAKASWDGAIEKTQLGQGNWGKAQKDDMYKDWETMVGQLQKGVRKRETFEVVGDGKESYDTIYVGSGGNER